VPLAIINLIDKRKLMNSQDLEKKYRQFVVTLNNFLYNKQVDSALKCIRENFQEIKLSHCSQYFIKDPSFYLGSILCNNEENVNLINNIEPTIIDLFKGSIYSKNRQAFSQLVKFYKKNLIEDLKLNEEMNNYLNYKFKNDTENSQYYKEVLKNENMHHYSFNLDFWNALVNQDFLLADEMIKNNIKINYNYQNVAKYNNHVFHQISYAWDETENNINHFKKICQYFIDKDFNANLINTWDNSILNSMVRIKKFAFAKIFLNLLYPKDQINQKNSSGKTLLHSLFYDKTLAFYIKQVIINKSNQSVFVNATEFMVDMVKFGADLDLPSGLHNRGKTIKKILKENEEILIYLEKKQLENAIILEKSELKTSLTANSIQPKKNKGKI
jgi:hypothetical protein